MTKPPLTPALSPQGERKSKRPKAWLLAALAGLWLAASPAMAWPWDGGYRKGDHVLFSGQVTGSDGKPVSGVTVLLELSRTSFSVRKFKQVTKNTLRIPVTTTVDGRYLHDWRWDGYYNTFELAVATPAAQGEFEVLHRVDVTERVRASAPEKGAAERDVAVVTPLAIEGTGDLGWLQRLLDGDASDEEQRIFREMGQPDRVDVHERGGSAWWYFEAGKVYRFRDGALEQVEHFEPILPP